MRNRTVQHHHNIRDRRKHPTVPQNKRFRCPKCARSATSRPMFSPSPSWPVTLLVHQTTRESRAHGLLKNVHDATIMDDLTLTRQERVSVALWSSECHVHSSAPLTRPSSIELWLLRRGLLEASKQDWILVQTGFIEAPPRGFEKKSLLGLVAESCKRTIL